MLAALLRECGDRDVLGELRRDHDHAVGVADDQVAGQDERAAAGDRDVRLERVVDQPQHGGVRLKEVRRDVQLREGGAVTDPAVGHDPGRAAERGPRGQDVPDRPGVRLAARVDDKDLVGSDRLDRGLLGVELGAARVAHVLAQGDVAQGLGVAEQPQVRARRPQPADDGVADAVPRELDRERRDRHVPQRRLGLAGEPRGLDAGECARLLGHLRIRPVGGKRRPGLDDGAAHAAATGQVDLDDVARRRRERPRRRSGEHDVTGNKGHEPGEVGDQEGEVEDQA